MAEERFDFGLLVEKFRRLCERLGGRIEEKSYPRIGERMYYCVLPKPTRIEKLSYMPDFGSIVVETGSEIETLPASRIIVRGKPYRGYVGSDMDRSTVSLYDVEVGKMELRLIRGKALLEFLP